MSMLNALVRTLILPAAAAALTAPALGAGEPAEEKPSAGQEAAQESQAPPAQQLAAVQKRLDEIKQAALKANPGLKKRRKKVESMIADLMRKEGLDPEKEEQRLAELKQAAVDETDDFKRRKALSDEYRSTRLKLAEARQKAMENEAVKDAGRSLREDILAAMRKQDPETDELMAEARELSKEVRRRRPPMGR